MNPVFIILTIALLEGDLIGLNHLPNILYEEEYTFEDVCVAPFKLRHDNEDGFFYVIPSTIFDHYCGPKWAEELYGYRMHWGYRVPVEDFNKIRSDLMRYDNKLLEIEEDKENE